MANVSEEELIATVKEWLQGLGWEGTLSYIQKALAVKAVPVCSMIVTVFDNGNVALAHNCDDSRDVVQIVKSLRVLFDQLADEERERMREKAEAQAKEKADEEQGIMPPNRTLH